MRSVPARRLAVTALCAGILMGVTGPVAMASEPEGHRGSAVAHPSQSDADTRLSGSMTPGASGDLTSITELLEAVLAGGGGPALDGGAEEIRDAVEAAVAGLMSAVAGGDALPAPVTPPPAPPEPVTLPAPVTSSAPTVPTQSVEVSPTTVQVSDVPVGLDQMVQNLLQGVVPKGDDSTEATDAGALNEAGLLAATLWGGGLFAPSPVGQPG